MAAGACTYSPELRSSRAECAPSMPEMAISGGPRSPVATAVAPSHPRSSRPHGCPVHSSTPSSIALLLLLLLLLLSSIPRPARWHASIPTGGMASAPCALLLLQLL